MEERESQVLFLWSQLVRKRDVTKEIKADTVHAQALRSTQGVRAQLARGLHWCK